MKYFSGMLVLLLGALVSRAQLVPKKTCGEFYVDILDGRVNNLRPNAGHEEIKGKFPCFTSTDAEGSSSKCGGNVSFSDKDIYFYTDRDYVEIGGKFKGKLSIPLLGAKRGSLFQYLGNPKLKDDKWDAYQTSYGILVLHYGKDNKVNLIQFSTQTAETLSLCE